MLFTHCYAGESGSVHDATVLRRSEIWADITERAAEKFPNDTHILGDKAYPCVPQLMNPYRNNGHLNVQQQQFNCLLSKSRSTIERAFGLLKNWMRCLKFLDVRCINWIPKYIIACCVLHNICILHGDVIDMEPSDIPDEDADIQHANIDEDRQRRELGMIKRNRICDNF